MTQNGKYYEQDKQIYIYNKTTTNKENSDQHEFKYTIWKNKKQQHCIICWPVNIKDMAQKQSRWTNGNCINIKYQLKGTHIGEASWITDKGFFFYPNLNHKCGFIHGHLRVKGQTKVPLTCPNSERLPLISAILSVITTPPYLWSN